MKSDQDAQTHDPTHPPTDTVGGERTPLDVSDPAATEALGRSLAARLCSDEVDVVLVENEVPSLVLGHVVARELGVRLVFAFDDGGLLDASSPIPSGSRVVLLNEGDATSSAVRSVVSWLERKGAVLADTLAPSAGGSPTPKVGP